MLLSGRRRTPAAPTHLLPKHQRLQFLQRMLDPECVKSASWHCCTPLLGTTINQSYSATAARSCSHLQDLRVLSGLDQCRTLLQNIVEPQRLMNSTQCNASQQSSNQLSSTLQVHLLHLLSVP